MDIVESHLSCFVISPIGDRHAELGTLERGIWEDNINVWEEVISPACTGLGLTAIRADQINEAGEITDQIFRKLRDSHVVIADLTGANPNVMYELGLRHTTGKLTVHIGEVGRLPFDVNTIRTIIFKRTSMGLINARLALTETLAAGMQGRFGQILATKVWLEINQAAPPLQQEEDTSEEITEAPGFLEMLADMDSARADMFATISAIGNIVEEIGSATTQATKELTDAGGPAAPIADRVVISNKLAEKIEDPIGRLEVLAKSLADAINKADPGTRYQIDNLLAAPDDGAKSLLSTLRTLFVSIVGSFDTTKAYRDTFTGPSPTRAQGIQYRRITAALDVQMSGRSLVEQWIKLIDRKV